jgi:hypothetical protein
MLGFRALLDVVAVLMMDVPPVLDFRVKTFCVGWPGDRTIFCTPPFAPGDGVVLVVVTVVVEVLGLVRHKNVCPFILTILEPSGRLDTRVPDWVVTTTFELLTGLCEEMLAAGERITLMILL